MSVRRLRGDHFEARSFRYEQFTMEAEDEPPFSLAVFFSLFWRLNPLRAIADYHEAAWDARWFGLGKGR
jgi:hypothetical protein